MSLNSALPESYRDMIGEVLALMRDQLNAYLRAQAGKPASHAEDKVQ